MKENELDDLSEKKESEQDSNSIDIENPVNIKEVNQDSDEDEDIQRPRIQTIDDLLRDDSEVINYSFASYSLDSQNNDILLAKYLYISKDFIFMFTLLMSSSLNFSFLYYPFLFLSIICFFLLFSKSKSGKKYKFIIELISLIYSIGLLAIKIYFIVLIKSKEKRYDEDKKQFLIDLGILLLFKTNSNFFMIITFFGEALVFVISIVSLTISHLCEDFDTSDNVDKNMTKNEFYKMLAICIYLVYFNILGFAIFNRSILTLCYITPMNLLLYFLSTNSNRRLLFFVFKFLNVFQIIAISIQIILINIFNINSIRNSYIDNDDMPYPKIVNIWTKIGINQAFDMHMEIETIVSEFCAYLFAVSSLLALSFSFNKLTMEKMKIANQNISNIENEEEEEEEKNCIIEIYEKIKNYFLSPSFISHICRISAVFWLYFYQNFYSIGVIIWLLFAFLFKHIKSNRFVTIIFLSPMVIICLFCYHLSNIDGFFENIEDNKQINYRRF